MHGFQVRTPICHIVPVSRAYVYRGGGVVLLREEHSVTDASVDQKVGELLVHVNFRGSSYGPIPWCLVFREKSVWTNGPESS